MRGPPSPQSPALPRSPTRPLGQSDPGAEVRTHRHWQQRVSGGTFSEGALPSSAIPPGWGAPLGLAGSTAAYPPQVLGGFYAPPLLTFVFLFDLFCLGYLWWDLPWEEGPISGDLVYIF